MTPKDEVELGHLIARMIDDDLSAEEFGKLERRLLDDAEARAFYHRYVALDVELSWNHADAVIPTAPPVPRRRVAGRVVVTVGVVAALAATVLLVAWLGGPPPIELPPAVIARLAEAGEDTTIVTEDGQSVPAVAGQDLHAGETIRTGGDDGFAVVEFPDASRFQLTADTVLRLTRADDVHLFLSQGLLRAELARQGVVLATPHAEVRGAGSRLVSFIEPDETRIELEEGAVQVKRRADGRRLDLGRGQFTVAKSDLGPMGAEALPRSLTEPRLVLKSPARAMAWHPNGDLVGAWKNKVTFWNPAGEEKKKPLDTSLKEANFIAVSADGRTLVMAEKGLIEIWDAAARRERRSIECQRSDAAGVALSPDGRLVAAVVLDAPRQVVVKVWDTTTGDITATLPGGGPKEMLGQSLAFSPDGTKLAAPGPGGKLIVWDVATQKPSVVPAGQAKGVVAVAFSLDGGRLAVGGAKGAVTVHDTARGENVLSLPINGRRVTALAFAPDRPLLAVATNDGTVRLWELTTGREVAALTVAKQAVRAIAFSSDGRTLAAAGDGRALQLWTIPDQD